jgi:tRNA(fMet)-specific endonuclease VapC
MSALYMLDTDIASYVIKGRPASVEAKLSGIDPSLICISVITRAELLYGLQQLDPAHRIHIAVRRFLKIVRVLSWDSEAADFYAEIRHRLKTTGQPIGELDMMIAAHSLAAAAILVTNNTRHYERISAPLILQNWCETAAP